MEYTISLEHTDGHVTKFPLPVGMRLGKVISLAQSAFKVNTGVVSVAIFEDGEMVGCYDGETWR